MTFWCGSGSVDPCLGLMDPDPDSDPDTDPDPAIFVIDFQDANKNLIKKKVFLLITYFLKVHLPFFKDKKSKRSHKTVGMKVFLNILLDDRRIRIHTSE